MLATLLMAPALARAESPTDPVLKSLVQDDQGRACQLALAAAQSGELGDEFFVGTCLETGTGMPQDFAQAASWFRVAMKGEDHLAQAHLGQLMVQGLVEGGAQEGTRLAKEAAEYGGPEAEMIYGRLLWRQRQPTEEAVRWLKRSVASNYPGGAYELSRFYASQGDQKQADQWQAKAKDMETARGSFADAVAFAYSGKTRESAREVYNRGYRILAGQEQGTIDQAVELVRNAAYQQVKEAEAQLGLMYLHGAGMPQDTIEATYWFRRAALHGSPDAKRLLEDALTSPQAK